MILIGVIIIVLCIIIFNLANVKSTTNINNIKYKDAVIEFYNGSEIYPIHHSDYNNRYIKIYHQLIGFLYNKINITPGIVIDVLSYDKNNNINSKRHTLSSNIIDLSTILKFNTEVISAYIQIINIPQYNNYSVKEIFTYGVNYNDVFIEFDNLAFNIMDEIIIAEQINGELNFNFQTMKVIPNTVVEIKRKYDKQIINRTLFHNIDDLPKYIKEIGYELFDNSDSVYTIRIINIPQINNSHLPSYFSAKPLYKDTVLELYNNSEVYPIHISDYENRIIKIYNRQQGFLYNKLYGIKNTTLQIIKQLNNNVDERQYIIKYNIHNLADEFTISDDINNIFIKIQNIPEYDNTNTNVIFNNGLNFGDTALEFDTYAINKYIKNRVIFAEYHDDILQYKFQNMNVIPGTSVILTREFVNSELTHIMNLYYNVLDFPKFINEIGTYLDMFNNTQNSVFYIEINGNIPYIDNSNLPSYFPSGVNYNDIYVELYTEKNYGGMVHGIHITDMYARFAYKDTTNDDIIWEFKSMRLHPGVEIMISDGRYAHNTNIFTNIPDIQLFLENTPNYNNNLTISEGVPDQEFFIKVIKKPDTKPDNILPSFYTIGTKHQDTLLELVKDGNIIDVFSTSSDFSENKRVLICKNNIWLIDSINSYPGIKIAFYAGNSYILHIVNYNMYSIQDLFINNPYYKKYNNDVYLTIISPEQQIYDKTLPLYHQEITY